MKASSNKRIYGLSLLGLFVLLLLNQPPLVAQNLRPGHSLTSRSKQFVITSSVNAPLTTSTTKSGSIPERVRLTPAALTTFVGSVRKQWVQKYKINSNWQGRIYLHIVQGKYGDQPNIRRIPSPTHGWDYRAILPYEMASRTLTQLVINLLLQEFAGRYATEEPHLPPWITTGTAELILQTSGPILFVPFHTSAGGAISFTQPHDPLHASRKIIQDSPTVSFLQMSLPSAKTNRGDAQFVYRAHSHLLVYKILEQNEGNKRLQFFLRELHKHKNSAPAFGIAFGHKNMLQIEQWWTLSQTQFRSRDAYNRWRPKVVLTHLADSLLIRTSIPSESESKPKLIPIQDYLTDGTPIEHIQKIKPILQRLKFLQVNAPPETARLILDYRSVLEAYSKRLKLKPIKNPLLLGNTVHQLNLLDTILADMSTKPDSNAIKAKQIQPVPR